MDHTNKKNSTWCALGIDIGGTTVKLGLVDKEGQILVQGERSVNFDGYQTPIVNTVIAASQAFLEEYKEFVPVGIGVSTTGLIDSQHGRILSSWLPDYTGTALGERLKAALSLPTFVENDAACATMAEMWVGTGKKCRDLVCVTIGTGIGSGVVCAGHLLRGRHGFAGECGHFPIHAGSRQCACGNSGCWQIYASITALIEAAATIDSDLTDGRSVFERVKKGDMAMQAVLDSWIDEIAVGLSGMVRLFDPEKILIGGGVSREEDLLIKPLRDRTLARLRPIYRSDLAIEAATLHNNAGIVGAVYNLREQLQKNGTEK